MKEHVINTWCDACLGDDGDGRRQGWTHSVNIDGERAEVDLCERHTAQLLAPLAKLMEAHGVSPAVRRAVAPQQRRALPSAEPQDGTCPFCSNVMRMSSLVNHVYIAHGGCGPNDPRPVVNGGVCPECGVSFADNPPVLGAHRMRKHGVSGLDVAVTFAKSRMNGVAAAAR